jgi:hypothetical protein
VTRTVTDRRRARGGQWHDLNHIGQFVRVYCQNSPHGEPFSRLYDEYLTTTAAPVPGGLFRWALRQRYDTVWLGPKSGGEWVLGLRLRCSEAPR